MSDGSAVVVGVGTGLGASLARRFAAGGLDVAMAARRVERLGELADEVAGYGVEALPYACDASDEAQVVALFDAVEAELGPVRLVVFNAGTFEPGRIREIASTDFERCWRVGCLGGFLVGREAAHRMAPRGAGTLLFTGATASLRGGAGFANLAVAKFGLRALAQTMARELAPEGVHVAHVIIDGQIRSERYAEIARDRGPDSLLEPEAVAESYWQLHCQPRNAWTHELDLRPWVEPF